MGCFSLSYRGGVEEREDSREVQVKALTALGTESTEGLEEALWLLVLLWEQHEIAPLRRSHAIFDRIESTSEVAHLCC